MIDIAEFLIIISLIKDGKLFYKEKLFISKCVIELSYLFSK